MQKFKFLRQPLLWELAMSPEEEREREEEEKKVPFTVATYVYASSQGQRTHSARTKLKGWNSNSAYIFVIQNSAKKIHISKLLLWEKLC